MIPFVTHGISSGLRILGVLLLASLASVCVPLPANTATASDALLTDSQRQRLFAGLDLARPALAAVRQAVESGDLQTAESRFANYLRNRQITTWHFAPPAPGQADRGVRFDSRAADAAASGHVSGGAVRPGRDFPDNNINWLHNETTARPGLAYNPEWQWQLCRMYFWSDLASAYLATGDERYARAWVTQFRSFIRQCPPPEQSANKHGSAWRTLDAAIRISRLWPEAWHSFLRSPVLTDEDLLLYALSTLQHAQYLRAWPTAANWLTTEMSGLYAAGAVFPEFKDAALWRQYAVRRLHDEIKKQFLPDGAQFEYSTGYHNGALNSVLSIPRFAKITGRLDEIPHDYIASLERAFDFNLYLMTPDRDLPRFNDSWHQDIRRILGDRGLEFFPGRRDFLWIATDGKQGQPPTVATTTASRAFNYAGYYAMRSGWERDANYAAFDAGKPGYLHVHQDKLNLVLWSYGREILFDSGGGSYERSERRHYAVSTFSHNTVLVDGKPQRRQTKNRETNVSRVPLENVRWESTPDHDYVSGIYNEGYGTETDRIATHTRQVFFLKPDIFVVTDTLVPNDNQPHTYQARWHLLPTATRQDSHAVLTTDPGLANLAIVPLRTAGLEVRAVSAQSEPELLGWDIPRDATLPSIPATTVTHTRTGTRIQFFTTLLLPLRKAADTSANPVTAIDHADSGVIRVTLADGRLLIIDAGMVSDAPLTVSASRP